MRPLRDYACIGCGKRRVAQHWSYCEACKDKLEAGWETLDDADLLTKRECRRWVKQLSGVE